MLAAASFAAAAQDPAVRIEADRLTGTPGGLTQAEGAVDLRRADVRLQADRLSYTPQDDRAVAQGQVTVSRGATRFSGPQLDLTVERFEGVFAEPEFEFGDRGTRGRAASIEFEGQRRFRLLNPQYTSCPSDGSADPDWLLTARELRVDLDANEAVASGAVLRFLGVPVLAVPTLRFPVSDERKSGWLAPALRVSTQSGLEVGVPYYWNIAPNRDATITPRWLARRGLATDAEYRYLETAYTGQWHLDLLPRDQLESRSRYAAYGRHEGRWPIPGASSVQGRYDIDVATVSDDLWWKDFDTDELGMTPRLLRQQARAEFPLRLGGQPLMAYASAQRWQPLQVPEDTFTVPYQRGLQLGATASGLALGGWQWQVEAELNRFTLPDGSASSTRPTGQRAHILAQFSRPWREGGLWLTPRTRINAASYALDQALGDGRRALGRAIPTFSLDGGLNLERDLQGFGRLLRQTLEPRLMYVYTPARTQRAELRFDSAPADFGFSSVFTENDFSGIDQVSDANLLNAGLFTRVLDAQRGDELLRLGLVQRFLLANQQLTPLGGSQTSRISDLLILGSSQVIPSWVFDASVRWNADSRRPVRSVLSASHAAGEGRSVTGAYRYAKDQSEQIEVGGQWLLSSGAGGAASGSGCTRRVSGIGRLDYSVRDQRLTGTTLGLEIDGSCWTGRVLAQRTSTGAADSATAIEIQLELTGLTRRVGARFGP
jgi:LPS-assembly protein